MANFYISEKDWNTIQNYSRYAWEEHGSEIGGFLIAELDKDSKWKLHKPVILEQTISAGNTVLDKDACSEYYVKTALKMKKKPFQFVWWHSHHTMNVFWSGTDLTAIDEFSEGTMSISLVVNLKEEYKLRVNLWKPYKMHQDVEMDIIRKDKTKKVPKSISDKVDELCSKPQLITTHYYHGGQYTYNGNYRWSNNDSKQQTIFNDSFEKDDKEMVQLEALIDAVFIDYQMDSNYKQYLERINTINTQLKEKQSELRVGICKDKEILFDAINYLPADAWIHLKNMPWSVDDAAIEQEMDRLIWPEDKKEKTDVITKV